MRIAILCFAAIATGCLSPSPAPTVRWFAPLVPNTTTDAHSGSPLPLALARIQADAQLDDRMLLRTSDVEFFPDDLHRWVAAPVDFVTQALERTLFSSGRFTSTSSDPTLHVHLRSFEAVLGAKPAVAVVMDLELRGATGSPRTTVRAIRPMTDDRPESIARELGTALAACANDVATWTAENCR